MIKLDDINTFNFDGAIVGMRNPMLSHDVSDSAYCFESNLWGEYVFGENDLKLAKKLIKAGASHRKFLRQIFISINITANLKWWDEFDTYEHTVTNSTSQMHKLMSKSFEPSDFSQDFSTVFAKDHFYDTIVVLNNLRERYLLKKEIGLWRDVIEILPQSYLYTRATTLNYEVFLTQYFQRKNHKMKEWRTYCEELRWELPYMDEFLTVLE